MYFYDSKSRAVRGLRKTRVKLVFGGSRNATCGERNMANDVQSAARGVGELRGSKNRRLRNGNVLGSRPAGTASELSRTTAGLRGAEAAARATLKSRILSIIFHTLPFVRTKGNTKNRRGETISGSALRLR